MSKDSKSFSAGELGTLQSEGTTDNQSVSSAETAENQSVPADTQPQVIRSANNSNAYRARMYGYAKALSEYSQKLSEGGASR